MKRFIPLMAAAAMALGTSAIAQTTADPAKLTGQERSAAARAKAEERRADRVRNENAATPAIPATRAVPANPATGTAATPAIRATPAVPAHKAPDTTTTPSTDTTATTSGTRRKPAKDK